MRSPCAPTAASTWRNSRCPPSSSSSRRFPEPRPVRSSAASWPRPSRPGEAPVKFVVLGAGATGGLLGAHLTRVGEDVILIARGAHLAAMRARGLRVTGASGEFLVHPECTDQLSPLKSAEVVLITLKAHSLPEMA